MIAQELLPQGDRLVAILWLLGGTAVIGLMLWVADRRRR